MQQQEVLRAWILMICSNRGLGADGGGAAYESHRLLRLCRRRGEPVVDLDEDTWMRIADAMRHGMMQGFRYALSEDCTGSRAFKMHLRIWKLWRICKPKYCQPDGEFLDHIDGSWMIEKGQTGRWRRWHRIGQCGEQMKPTSRYPGLVCERGGMYIRYGKHQYTCTGLAGFTMNDPLELLATLSIPLMHFELSRPIERFST